MSGWMVDGWVGQYTFHDLLAAEMDPVQIDDSHFMFGLTSRLDLHL